MDGKRLAKRNGGQTLADLRAAGADPERLITDLRRNVFPVGISIANAYIEAMTTFLVILLILAAIATVVALVRRIVSFLRTTEEDLTDGQQGPSASSRNKTK